MVMFLRQSKILSISSYCRSPSERQQNFKVFLTGLSCNQRRHKTDNCE
ncbi:hypothetical protein FHR87_003916 [Azomonas macrocytogenes]|uniref:Uncharacterized protein n=1 Tax=Azomonas macrocytogenes TaxID=69962 RepID=A0A839TCY1_AZOMA|nr:hypothetical protein [Azomonas macrocytogenes]